MSPLHLPPDARTIVLIIDRPLGRADVAELCECVCVFLQCSDAELVVCDVGALLEPDAATVDALARLRLAAGRLGCQVRLRHVSPTLLELLAFMGLGDVLPPCAVSGLETRRQIEEREQARGFEEEADRRDPPG